MARVYTLPISAGSEPELSDIADATEAVGELGTDDLGNPVEFCDASPHGQCEFSSTDGHYRCIHCKRENSI